VDNDLLKVIRSMSANSSLSLRIPYVPIPAEFAAAKPFPFPCIGLVARFITCMETKLAESSSETIRDEVRRRYGATVRGETSSCGDGCCTSTSADMLGYSAEQSAIAPEAANLGLGCGNPLAIASLLAGQVVLDLGSGAGFDCFLAARAVGSSGKVIGVDMTHEMLSKARENAQKNGFTNVEFRLGEIEALPVADNSIDVIISNCVINLSPEKERVFNEAFRVLKPGGRLAVADMVATAPLPNEIKTDWAAYTGCMAGASQITELERMLQAAGFKTIQIEPKDTSRSFIREWLPGKRVEDYLVSATIEAVKPSPVVG
jgi:arsenite methyltransferase